jgi:hypothetical protein
VEHVVEMLKMREVYRHLSNAADRGDEAGNIIADIVVKITRVERLSMILGSWGIRCASYGKGCHPTQNLGRTLSRTQEQGK